MHDMSGYGHPSKNRPQWYAGYLVFQNGVPMLKRSSLTGGGVIYPKDWTGNFQPVVVVHTSPTTSLTGPGSVPSRFPFLTSLFGGKGNGA